MCSIISLEVSKECTLAKDISHNINSATPSPVVKASEVGELKQVMLETSSHSHRYHHLQHAPVLPVALHRVHTQATHHKISQKYSCKKTLLSILTIIIVINIYIHSKKLGRLT